MKLRNKKTGEIVEDGYVRETHDFQFDGQKHVLAVFKGNGHRPPERVSGAYTSLAELNEDWEDYEEPKHDYYFIRDGGNIDYHWYLKLGEITERRKEIGNYFETKEEAERAVEKLKAWTRLRDKGFKFEGIKQDYTRFNQQEPTRTGKRYLQFNKSEDDYWMKENWDDLDLLFGEEEE